MKEFANMLSRREFLGGSIAAAAAFAALPQKANSAENKETRPNILFIITNHQSFYGHDREGEFDGALHVDRLLEYFSKAN